MEVEFREEDLGKLKVIKGEEKGHIVKMNPIMSEEEKEFCNFISLIIYSSFKETLNNKTA